MPARRAVLHELPSSEFYSVQPHVPVAPQGVRLISDGDVGKLFNRLVDQKTTASQSTVSVMDTYWIHNDILA